MTDDAPRWLDEDVVPQARSRRLPVLLVAAVVPWAVLAVVLVRGGGAPVGSGGSLQPDAALGPTDDVTAPSGAPEEHGADEHGADQHGADQHGADQHGEGHGADQHGGHHPGADGTVAGTDLPAAAPPGDDLGGSDEARPDGAVGLADHPTRVAHGVAEALVVALTRAWLSDAGPDLEVTGLEVDRTGYLEHVAVERIVLSDEDLAVATVTVVVLERDADRYADATVRRVAVPLRVTPTTVHPAGQPWWLPQPLDLTPRPPATTALDDPDVTAAVDAALTEAGYRDHTVEGLAVTDAGTVVADITAATVGGEPQRSAVWLRRETDGTAVVLGHHEDDTT